MRCTDEVDEATRRDQQLRLADGRMLGFAEWGDPDGELVVVDFHGGPGCRLSVSVDPDELTELGVRWLTVDRPGLGLSWPQPGRRVVDFVDDVVSLLDHLRVDEFAAMGWSMGGPYAAACAAMLGQRVVGVGLLAPAPATLDQPGAAERMGKDFAWVLARDNPWEMVNMYTALGLEARRDPPRAIELFSRGLSSSELAIFRRPEVSSMFIETMVEATRQGAVGLVQDLRAELEPWGFDPHAMCAPAFLWQGDDDSFVSVDMAEQWQAVVPSLDVRILSGEGHLFSLVQTTEVVKRIKQLAS